MVQAGQKCLGLREAGGFTSHALALAGCSGKSFQAKSPNHGRRPSPAGELAMTSGVQGLRVLVVEDVFLIAESLGELLQHYGCYVVGPVATLEQGLDMARDTPLDGAILDV